ncbi:MAG: hypothetical protein AAF922_05765 [Pseudomonadota bacterium]
MTPKLRGQTPSLWQGLSQQKWLTLIGLPILIYSTIEGLFFVWGLLFAFWGLGSLRTGRIFLLEAIDRRDDPALFWAIFAMWLGSAATYIYYDITRFL